MKEVVRELLYSKVNLDREFTELLGAGTGNKRSCWNKPAHKNGDRVPALTFDPKTGAWICRVCQEKGDLFTLYKKVRNQDFPKTLLELAKKYQITELINEMDPRKFAGALAIRDEIVKTDVRQATYNWVQHPELREFMFTRYGLTQETLVRWSIGYDTRSKRVTIPVWRQKSLRKFAWDGIPDTKLADIVNVRSHDVFRTHAQWRNTENGIIWTNGKPPNVTLEAIAKQHTVPWEPFWTEKSGKTLSVRGYGRCYLYPYEVIDSPFFYLVGGELKALLLNQLGVPAMSFTTGEGGYDEMMIPLFVGKRVRVLMDVDEAGVNAANIISRVLADSGAYVEKGVWREEIAAHLPAKGDVTDYLAACDWKVEALDFLEWQSIEPTVATELSYVSADARKIIGAPDCEWEKMSPVSFNQLVEPRGLRTWVKVPALVSGRGETPFAVPRRLDVTCEEGRKRFNPRCASCPLYKQGFATSMEYTTAAQLELVGMHSEVLRNRIMQNIGIPKGCPYPEFDETSSAVETLMLTPTVDANHTAGDDNMSFVYRHQMAYALDESQLKLEENHSYEFGGRIMADPKTGKFTFAIRSVRPLDTDILDPNQPHPEFRRLQRHLNGPPDEIVPKLLTTLREHTFQIYHQDRMLLTILLGMHLPFTFNIGQFFCERMCPSILVLGDTTVGKSTATQRLLRLYRAGRYANAEADPTFAGLIGGNLQQGQNKMSFSWGLIPTTHRAFLALDEYNKLPVETIGKMTNTLSSGIAERTTANGTRKTLSWVRLLYLANPRGERPLKSFVNGMDAALGVAGTTQDLGRIDYVHIQHQLADTKALFRAQAATSDNWYDTDLARAHLAWSWSKKPRQFVWEDAQYTLSAAEDIADMYGHHTLCIPAQFRFKLARFAAAVAILCASGSPNEVLIRKVDVDYAAEFFKTGYAPYLDQYRATSNDVLSPKAMAVLERLSYQQSRKLRGFIMFDAWTESDMAEMLGSDWKFFVDEIVWQQAYVKRMGGNFKLHNPRFRDMMNEYINMRERREIEQTVSTRPF